MPKGTPKPLSQSMAIHMEEHYSPNGGLRGIRLRNGWDDSMPPVIRPEFLKSGQKLKTATDSESAV